MSKKLFSLFLSFLIIFTSVLSVDMTAFSAMRSSQSSVPGIDYKNSLSVYDEFNSKTAKGSFIIPGLTEAVSCKSKKRYDVSNNMIVQGICNVGIYTLITAYDSEGDFKSVVFVLDQTKKLIRTLILPDKSHVGGIAYDIKNKLILIAKGNSKCVSIISYNDFKRYLSFKTPFAKIQYTVSASQSDTEPYGASGVTYYNGLVHIFYFSSASESRDFCYEPEYNEEEKTYTLKLKYTMSVPDFTQGMTIINYNGKTKLFVSVSYGRSENKYYYLSYLYTYTFDNETGDKQLDNVLACPPMLEQTCVSNRKLYCLFESASALYRTVNKNPVDRVVPLDLDKLCDEKRGTVVNIKTTNTIGGKTVSITSANDDVKLYYSTIMPYISYGKLTGGYKYEKPYLKTSSSRVYAVAVCKGKIIAADSMDISIDKSPMPKGLKVKKTAAKSITISWKKAKGVQGYYVYRSEKPDEGYEICAQIKGNKSSYKDKGLKSNKKYYYKIISYKSGCRTSDKTEYICAKTKKS